MPRLQPSSSIVLGGTLAFAVALLPSCRQDPPPEPPSTAEEPPATQQSPVAWVGIDLNGKALYSQHNEELITRDFFQDRRDGFFLDVGCFTPIVYNNTAYLEKHLGWSGIAVDALPEYEPRWKRRRPKSKFFNYLVTDHEDTVEPFYRSELPGISSIQKPLKGPGGDDLTFEEIQVPTITLTRLLEQNGVQKIDFLSMDIEGAELLALAGFDIERFRPELACIEAKPANREGLLKYFASHNYEWLERYFQYDEHNYYFAPKVAGR
ncbi:MAG: FkbM family methyltransferase [Vicinamibacteria bacterium]